jgi:transposase
VTASETIAALTAALAAEGEARQQAEALVDYYKLQIARLWREQQSSGRGRKLLDQLELQLEEAAAIVAEDEIIAAPVGSWGRSAAGG